MFNSINSWVISGNLGQDPDMSYTPNGTAVTKFSVSVSGWDGKNDTTSWIRVVVFGKPGEQCEKWLKKGAKVIVQGRYQDHKYTDKNNIERLSVELVANDVSFVSGHRTKQEVDSIYGENKKQEEEANASRF